MMGKKWLHGTTSSAPLRFRETHRRWWVLELVGEARPDFQACLLCGQSALLPHTLCEAGPFAHWPWHTSLPRITLFANIHCLSSLPPTHVRPSYRLCEAFPAASPRSLARMGHSLPSLHPHRALSVSLSDIYPFPALNYVVLHLLLRGRWWSELARCHQRHRTCIGGVNQCVFHVIQLIF